MKSIQTARRALVCLVAAFLLGACGGGDSEGSSSSSSSGGSTTTSGCSYPDVVTASERSRVTACGTAQVSTQFQAADSIRNAAIQNCQQGARSAADQIYQQQYLVQVQLARETLSRICR